MPQEKKNGKVTLLTQNEQQMNEWEIIECGSNLYYFFQWILTIYKCSSIAYFDFTIVIFPFSFEEF